MTENIKDFLELAAKACGIEHPEEDHCAFSDSRLWDCKNFRWWSPGEDDGDGARMEAELGIEFKWFDEYAHSHFFLEANKDIPEWGRAEHFSAHNGNKQAARKMASLRVAAEIGRRMKP